MIQGVISQLPFYTNSAKADTDFKGISIDTRTLKKGNIFICIVGDNFDGHDFILEAIKKGCSAVITQKEGNFDIPLLIVKNTYQALHEIAQWWRNKSTAQFVAITGSNGKTTTKEMLKAILSTQANTLATAGNLNNELGVPLTLCQLSLDDKYVIIEIGANHIEEIKPLSELVHPNIAVVTNVFEAHLGEFGSLQNIVKTKAEIYETLTQNDIAIVDDNSTHKDFFLERIKSQICFVNKDIEAKNIQNNQFELCYQKQSIKIKLNLLGQHQIQNALVAGLIALKLGLSLQQIKLGLEKCENQKGRLKVLKVDNLTFIDDSYNANPTSCKVALDVLSEYQNNTIAVLGDMGELGKMSEQFHKEVGEYAKEQGIKTVLSLGKMAKNYQGFHFASHQEIAQYLIDNVYNPTTILIKGSRFMKMEKVIDLYLSLKQATNCCND
jgi:UDP-N-acetylmuramoyl-tripeptide--D-alanyl-D-alanine ligase